MGHSVEWWNDNTRFFAVQSASFFVVPISNSHSVGTSNMNELLVYQFGFWWDSAYCHKETPGIYGLFIFELSTI
jgi:hypothetical protein